LSDPQLRPVTERELDLWRMPTIEAQMPVRFENGRVWEAFKGFCVRCHAEVPMGSLRGMISRPMPSVAVLEAIGYCGHCNVASTFTYRFHDDMTITGQDRSGRWSRWYPKMTVASKIKAFVTALLRSSRTS
jgi:hypothetical protein